MLDVRIKWTNMSLPSLSPPGSGLVETVTFAQTTRLLAGGSETTRFTMLVNGVDDPVDAGITAYCLVLRVDQDYLEILVCGVLIDPVRIKDSQVCTASSNTLLGRRLQRTLVLELVYTLVRGFSCEDKLSVTAQLQKEFSLGRLIIP